MQILSLTPQHLKTQIIIGFFDVLHHGHAQLFEKFPHATILTFKSIPRKLAVLNDLTTRLNNLKELGYEKVIVLEESDLKLTAQQFVDHYLKYSQQVIVGSDFIFGSDHQPINAFAAQLNLTLIDYDERYSTSKVKQYLTQGNLSAANAMLLKPYRIVQTIEHGNHVGRTLGFPTVNCYYPNGSYLQSGVYLTQTIVAHKVYKSLTVSIKQKALNDRAVDTLETHILNFNGDLYHHTVEVIFYTKLGELKKCDSIEELKQLIQAYVDQANSTTIPIAEVKK